MVHTTRTMLARVRLEEAGFAMRQPPTATTLTIPATSTVRRALLAAGVALLALLGATACAGGDASINTVADFDDRPCALFSGDAMTAVVTPPYQEAARATPTLTGTVASASDGDGQACTYTYRAPQTAIPQLGTFTVTVAHAQAGNQPLAICRAGVVARTAGYTAEAAVGDGACISPSADLWLQVASHYFHVVVVPQPGFADPLDRLQALSPLLLAVATSVAGRMPRS